MTSSAEHPAGLHPRRKTRISYALLSGCLVLLGFIYHRNLAWLWSSWMVNPDYSHGPLIPLISAFIVYLKWKDLRTLPQSSGTGGLVLVAAASALLFASIRMQVNFLQSYALILTIAGIVWSVYGRNVFRSLVFPIFFLIFMVPFWGTVIDKVGNVLKILSSVTSHQIIKLLGFPIYREGVILQLSRGSLEVADPCSGIRSLISLLAVGAVLAYFARTTLPKKFLITALAIPFAFLWNTVRVVVFGVILETTGVMIADGFWHTFTGIAVFALALISLIAMNKWIASE
jgi:exosortase